MAAESRGSGLSFSVFEGSSGTGLGLDMVEKFTLSLQANTHYLMEDSHNFATEQHYFQHASMTGWHAVKMEEALPP